MRSFFLKGLLVLFLSGAGAVQIYAAVDTDQTNPAQTITPATVSQVPSKNTDSQTQKSESFLASADLLPVQVAMVDGDYHKFEALNWLNRGYSGGVKDLSIHYQSGDDITIDAEGRAIAGNGDYKGSYSIKKEDVGYVDVDFKQFRKYYDTYGGIWQGFSPSLSRDLFLDIGHFGVEAGITMPDLPNISVYYDHDYKNGSKSMLDWASMAGFATKKICPAWKEIDESVDTFGIKGDYTEAGYHFSGDQRWEIAKTKTLSVEPTISMLTLTSPTSPVSEVRQYFTTDTTLMTTKLGADKWYLNDKVFASSGYRFEHLNNDQVQKRATFNTGGGLTNANNPDGDGHNNQDVNSWVLNLMVSPWSWLSGTGGFKAEAAQRDGISYYPNGAGTSNLKSNSDSDTYKFAESFGVRFKAIPRTAVYSDLSFEQSQNHLFVGQSENLTGVATQTRDAVINEPEITWVTGADFQPFRAINLTSQFRLQDKSMNFHDDPVRSTPSQGQVFLKKLNTHNLGFTERATARLASWAQTSVRYLFDNTDYDTRTVYETADSKANMMSNTFVYDLSVYPTSNLLMTGSFTQIYSQTKTVWSSRPNQFYFQQPFNSNSSTWMFATDYQPHKKVKLDGSLFYTLANNYENNQNTSLVNYAAAFNQMGLTVGCKWEVRKDLILQPQYGFSRYLPNERSGVGAAYDAQIISLSLIANWG